MVNSWDVWQATTKLNNGIPVEILPYDDPYVWEIIDILTPHFLKMGLAGPLNIQGRVTDHGLKLFEINPRFTGITGLRALMGFNEVEACVKEWLGIDRGHNKLFFNYALFGTRQTTDRVVPIARSKDVQNLSEQLNQSGYKRKERIFITGATGFLGQNLVSKLIDDKEYELWLYSRDKSRLKSIYGSHVESMFDKEDYDTGRIPFGNIDVLLHLGFARPQKSNQEIAKSLTFTMDLFTRAAGYNVPTVVNISSQSVYGNELDPPWNEDTPVCPSSVYGLAKYAAEVHLRSFYKQNKGSTYTSIRLGTLSGRNIIDVKTDFLSKMVAQAKNGENLTVFGGTQKIERLDIRDAVNGILRLIRQKHKIDKPVYNLSSGKQYELKEIAELIFEVAKEYNPECSSNINYQEVRNKYPSFGMSIHNFCESFEWTPKVTLKETISSMFKDEY
jgi:nucleoside-diphosphate-sugar epimerase